MEDRASLVTRVMACHERMQHLMATDRTNPLLHSTLTMQQLKTLLVLSQTDASSAHELAAAMGVSLATLTGIVDRLVSAGMVTRHEDERDRRVRRIVLTEEGHRTISSIVTAGREKLRFLLDRLDDEELSTVERALGALIRAAESADGPCD